MLKQTPALYPIRRVECKILTIPEELLIADKIKFFH